MSRSVMRAWRSLRVRIAVLGFLAGYVPVLLLFVVINMTEQETVETDGVSEAAISRTSTSPSIWVTATVVALGPVAAGSAWLLAGRTVQPISRLRSVAEDIEATDLSRRIALDRGPDEIKSLAASFDAMLDRLEDAANTQRRLVEETSHELRTPLSVLTANADVLLEHPDPSLELYRDGLQRSKAAAVRLRDTIDELLVDARGRARTLDRRPSDLTGVVRGVADEARTLEASRGVDVRLTAPSVAVCSIDEPTVRRALANLIGNAVRYAPDGSSVEVHVHATAAGARVVVTDHGPGITPEERDRIFEPFWRAHPHTPGTGLGLPIARHIARAHGGDLTVASPGPAGDGCVFELRLGPASS